MVSSLVHEPGAVQTSIGSEGCVSLVTVPTCWPSTRLAKESAVATRVYMMTGCRRNVEKVVDQQGTGRNGLSEHPGCFSLHRVDLHGDGVSSLYVPSRTVMSGALVPQIIVFRTAEARAQRPLFAAPPATTTTRGITAPRLLGHNGVDGPKALLQ